jgi:hypothetical protein
MPHVNYSDELHALCNKGRRRAIRKNWYFVVSEDLASGAFYAAEFRAVSQSSVQRIRCGG